ncbi:MAG: DUF1272 domain-containing protein [Gammaproteobacteria bacterium]|jgi:hypothetical protein
MLQLRPSCEHCDRELPPDSDEAMICSYECTFCRTCADQILQNVCPNCGGGFCLRPTRPQHNLKNGNYLGNHPASNGKIFKPVDVDAHNAFAKDIASIPPNDR